MIPSVCINVRYRSDVVGEVLDRPARRMTRSRAYHFSVQSMYGTRTEYLKNLLLSWTSFGHMNFCVGVRSIPFVHPFPDGL